MVPPGTKIIIHENPQQIKSWANHGVDGWYLGPAMQHYRCWRTYVIHTQAELIADAVELFPQHTKLLHEPSNERETVAAQQLVHELKHPQSQAPFSPKGDQQLQALTKLAKIFQT